MFLKKFRKQNFKWFYITIFNYLSTKSNLSAYFVIQFSNICEALVIVYLWFLVSPDPTIITYLLVGRIFNAAVYSFYHVDLGEDIAFGKISAKLMYPIDFLKIQIFSAVGERLAKNPATVIGFMITAVIGNFIFVRLSFASLANIVLTILLIPVGFFIQFLLNFLVGSLTFYVRPIRTINVKPQIFARTLFSNFNYSYKIDFINRLPDTNYLVLVSAGRNDYIVDSITTDSVSITLSLEAPFPPTASVTIIR